MNVEHLDVARELLKKAERFERWSKHDVKAAGAQPQMEMGL